MKAGGEGFFAAVDTYPYQTRGVLIGQITDESCVPACVRMLLLDEFPHLADDYRLSESFLRNALETTNKGSSVAGVPAVLRDMGTIRTYAFLVGVTLVELRKATRAGAAMAILRTTSPQSAHVVLVDEVTETTVAVRDPLPLGRGSVYAVALSEFMAVWANSTSQLGCAVTVLE